MSSRRALALALALAIPSSAWSADDEGPRNTITVNGAALLNGTVQLEYERAFGTWISLAIAPYALLFQGPLNRALLQQQLGDIKSFGLGLALRVFLLGKAPGGLWVGPVGQVGTLYVKSSTTTEEANAVGWSAGAQVGVTFLIFNLLDLSLGAGGEWYAYGATSSGGEQVSASGWMVSLRGALGIAF